MNHLFKPSFLCEQKIKKALSLDYNAGQPSLQNNLATAENLK